MDNLAKLIAIEEIKQLKARYFRLMDTRDFDGMAQVFCRDAVFDATEASLVTPLDGVPQGPTGSIKQGRDQIMVWIRESYANRSSAHHGHCHEVTIDSAVAAHGIIAMEDYIRAGDRQTEFVHAIGHYHETYRFEDGAWRIATIKLTRLFRDISA
jgi:hypothetical protein